MTLLVRDAVARSRQAPRGLAVERQDGLQHQHLARVPDLAVSEQWVMGSFLRLAGWRSHVERLLLSPKASKVIVNFG